MKRSHYLQSMVSLANQRTYVCVFVSLSVKAVHLELVSDLTTEAFIAALRRFIARRGHPSSDHGTNFVGANRELQQLSDFLVEQKTSFPNSVDRKALNGNSFQNVPHTLAVCGRLRSEAWRNISSASWVNITFEELTTTLTQIEACLNSRPLVPLNSCDDDGIEVLTPGHFLIGQPLSSIPDPSFSYRSVSLLRRWHLCQHLVRQFWKRWSTFQLLTNIPTSRNRRYSYTTRGSHEMAPRESDESVPWKRQSCPSCWRIDHLQKTRAQACRIVTRRNLKLNLLKLTDQLLFFHY